MLSAIVVDTNRVETQQLAEQNQLVALRHRVHRLLSALNVEDDQKLSDWLDQRLGLLAQRDTSMLHTLIHDIEKALKNKLTKKKLKTSNAR